MVQKLDTRVLISIITFSGFDPLTQKPNGSRKIKARVVNLINLTICRVNWVKKTPPNNTKSSIKWLKTCLPEVYTEANSLKTTLSYKRNSSL